jgi:hypothetical protein
MALLTGVPGGWPGGDALLGRARLDMQSMLCDIQGNFRARENGTAALDAAAPKRSRRAAAPGAGDAGESAAGMIHVLRFELDAEVVTACQGCTNESRSRSGERIKDKRTRLRERLNERLEDADRFLGGCTTLPLYSHEA